MPLIVDHEGRPLGRSYKEAARALGIAPQTLYVWRKRGSRQCTQGGDLVQIPPPPKMGRPARAVFELADGRRLVGLAAVREALGGITKSRVYQRFHQGDDGVWRERQE